MGKISISVFNWVNNKPFLPEKDMETEYTRMVLNVFFPIENIFAGAFLVFH